MSENPVKRVIPFNIVVLIESEPKEVGTQQGYQHTARATGKFNATAVEVKVSKYLGWTNAEHLSPPCLRFYVTVDASALVPLINKKNRE